ncbi:MAG: S8 family serine peptidase [Chlorobiales bacterium]|nr:S8 family serine peptidase [Chlorobiales bacterium]
MRTVKMIVLLGVLCLLSFGETVAQDTYFYSRDKKVTIKASPTKLVVINKTAYTEPQLKSWLGTSQLQTQYDLDVFNYDKQISIVTKKKDELVKLRKSLTDNQNFYMVNPVYLTDEGGELAPTDKILVRFKQDVTSEKIEQIRKEYKLESVKPDKRKRAYSVFRAPANSDPVEIANKIQETGLVLWSQPNFISELVKHQPLPNDIYFQRQFQMHNTGQETNDGRTGTADADVDGPEAWRYANGTDIVVAVIDEGVDLPHPDIPALRVVNGYDFGDDDNNPAPAGDAAHGTACAGIVGATQNNNLGVTGIAPNSKIMPIKIWRNNGAAATVQDIADAIDFAWQNGVHVLTNSWGFSSSNHDLHPAISDAIDSAVTRGRNGLGCVVVFAAGNTANHGTGSNGYVTFPGNRDEVLTIGASDRNDVQAVYSPTDDELDAVAPSHRAYTSQIATEDFEVWTTDINGNTGYNPRDNGTELPAADLDYTGAMGGTSAACPLVAGVAALVLDVNPNLTGQEVYSIIRASADKIDSTNASYDTTGHSRLYGYGRANAHRAIVPTVRIVIEPKKVKKGEPFKVTVYGTAPFGLKSVWWFGQNTGIADLDKAHWHDLVGPEKVYSYTWTATIDQKGKYKLGANVRDVLYPNPADGYPHQASEGAGIEYAEVEVVPAAATWASILTAMLFVLGFVLLGKTRNARLFVD